MPVKTPPREKPVVYRLQPPCSRDYGEDSTASSRSAAILFKPKRLARCFHAVLPQSLLWRMMGGHWTVWIQRSDPFDNWGVSTLVAALPILVLLGLLASGRVSAWRAALAGLLVASGVAWLSFRMPARMIAASMAVGVSFALLRIVWLIVAAVFLYDIAVATGQFEIMKASVARLSGDRRLQAVLVAFCFGAFIEGAAGFGAPVAISAAFLVGLGF